MMIGEGIFLLGERGLHVLFDRDTIEAAFEEDPAALGRIVRAHRDRLEAVLGDILDSDDAGRARATVAELEPALQHVLVHLYFEILGTRLRGRRAGPH